VKGRILKALRETNDYVSCQTLAGRTGISARSIEDHIRGLESDGYSIESSSTGYRLISSPDLLLPYEFAALEQRIRHFHETDSTMAVARKLAKEGVEQGTIVIAEIQTHGRGRLGREWRSPRGGIYLTIILRPKIDPTFAPRLTLMASVAVATTINRLFSLQARLKWPNDVLIQGRKVCGILAEIDADIDIVNFVNLGIGINANNSTLEFGNTATSLKTSLGRDVLRRDLLAALVREIDSRQDSLMDADLIEQWKQLSATLHTDVIIAAPCDTIAGRAIDIDTTGALIIEQADGSIKTTVAGDCEPYSLTE